VAAIAVGIACASAPAFAQHAGGGGGGGGHAGGGGGGHVGGGGGGHVGAAHQHFDSRFSHNQYYYDRGYGVHTPPAGGWGAVRGGGAERYYFHGGNWYRWRGGWYRWRGGSWIVCPAPIGLFVPFLPIYYTTVWWNGIPYYYANDTYYQWEGEQDQYEVVAPPADIESSGTTQAPSSNQLFAYPKNGQSPEQQAQDRYECERWAVGQTGFDPLATANAAPDKRDDYFRAEASCLEGRGYSVR
jgi:hypothetical protein